MPYIDQARYLTHPSCVSLRLWSEQVDDLWFLLGTNDVGPEPVVSQSGSWLGVGTVRLDDRSALTRYQRGTVPPANDLALLVRGIEAQGTEVLSQLAGDFAIVLFDRLSRMLFAVRDTLGVHPLYYRAETKQFAFSSCAALLAPEGHYDVNYIAAFVANSAIRPDQTPYAGVLALPAGHHITVARGEATVERYWDPARFAGTLDDATPSRMKELVEEFRIRLTTAVARRLTAQSDVWAQLSGGMDSSSVVSVAASLAESGQAPAGLSGTVTLVDRHGTGGDERAFSNAVVARYRLRNELIVDSEWWESDGSPPPRTDFPAPSYLVFARDRRVATIVRAAGGRVLLSGYGSDQYLGGSAIFFADWLATGRAGDAVREMARWSMIGRVSFWKLAFHNAIAPLLPSALRSLLLPATQLPPWLPRQLATRFDLANQHMVQSAYGGPLGRKYRTDITQAITGIPSVLAHHAVMQGIVEERHPFLDRALVEFSLSLPTSCCAQPGARKWILREAMRNTLPESIRVRRGKGSVDGATSWSLAHRREAIDQLLRDSILAQFGCLEPESLRTAVTRAVNGADHLRASVIRTLALETWLRARAGLPIPSGRRNDGRSAQPVSLT